MTDIYLHIVARMADYMATHPYNSKHLPTTAPPRRRNGTKMANGKAIGQVAIKSRLPSLGYEASDLVAVFQSHHTRELRPHGIIKQNPAYLRKHA